MRKLTMSLALTVAAALSGATASAQPATPWVYGTFLNHAGNVKVETKPCGTKLCGTVVWASPAAIKEARDAGTPNLVGMQLLRDFSQNAKGEWAGKVFVPDLKSTFSSRIYRLNDKQIRISGCILGGLVCKYQTWTRQ